MEKSYLIGHKDIAKAGYYFLDQTQEQVFLGKINDVFAMRVGAKVSQLLTEEELQEIISMPPTEIHDAMESFPGIEEIVTSIRAELLDEIKEARRTVLIEGSSHGVSVKEI